MSRTVNAHPGNVVVASGVCYNTTGGKVNERDLQGKVKCKGNGDIDYLSADVCRI